MSRKGNSPINIPEGVIVEVQPSLINTHALNVFSIIGNPQARTKSKRYIDYDLNRSFTKNLDIRVDAHIDPLNDNFYIKIYDNNCRFNYAKNL